MSRNRTLTFDLVVGRSCTCGSVPNPVIPLGPCPVHGCGEHPAHDPSCESPHIMWATATPRRRRRLAQSLATNRAVNDFALGVTFYPDGGVLPLESSTSVSLNSDVSAGKRLAQALRRWWS